MKKTLMMLWMAVSLMVSLVGCSSEEMDYENPDVTVFVKQLKAGTYNMKNEKGVVEVPHFTEEDIPELLKYAEDLTIIPSFPSVYNTNNGKIRLGGFAGCEFRSIPEAGLYAGRKRDKGDASVIELLDNACSGIRINKRQL